MTSTERTPRRTRQRTEIRDAVEASTSFATSQEIHDRLRRDGSTVGLATVYRALQAMASSGEVDAIRTPDGQIAPFRPGMEKILARAAARGQQVPVVPLALKNMWGSMWSNRDSRLRRARLPRRLWARIEVLAGPSVPGNEATAALLEEQVKALRGADA